MRRIIILALLAVSASAQSGCSYLTARGRAEAAYARYVRHASAGRVKLQHKLAAFPKMPATPSANEPTIAAGEGPESVTASNESQ